MRADSLQQARSTNLLAITIALVFLATAVHAQKSTMVVGADRLNVPCRHARRFEDSAARLPAPVLPVPYVPPPAPDRCDPGAKVTGGAKTPGTAESSPTPAVATLATIGTNFMALDDSSTMVLPTPWARSARATW